MADYNANIKVNADTRQAESQLKKLQNSLDKLSDISTKVNLQNVQQQFNKLGTTIKGIGERGALGAITLGAGKATVAIGGLGAKMGVVGAAAASMGAAVNGALGGVPGVVTDILAQLGNIPNAFGLAAVAAMAFAPQVLKASSATVGLGAAIDKAVGAQTTQKIADVVNSVGRLSTELEAAKATFADLIEGNTLNQLNSQLKDAAYQSGEFHSSTEEAVTAAQQLVAVQKEQRREQKAITDLIRQAQGLQPQDVRDTEVARRVALLKSREIQQKKDLQLQNQINAELAEYERLAAEVANQTKQWANNLDRIARSSKAGVLGSQSQIQARLQEFRENRRSAEIARERSRQLAGGQYSLAQVPVRGELFPGGRTQTAMEQYRFMLNEQASIQQAAASALERSERTLIGLQAQTLRTEQDITAAKRQQQTIDERSVQVIREQNALLLEQYRLEKRKPIAAMTPQQRAAAGVLDPASLRADRLRRVEEGRNQQRRRREAAGNALIGGAFPLLFGQGIGSSIGGGVGGAFGGMLGGNFGFGLSLVGTAIGQTFDTATQSAAEFAKALNDTGDATGVLEQALGSIDKDTKTFIQNLAQSGQTAAAAQASFNVLAEKIGVEQAKALQQAGEAVNDWGTKFQTWLTKTYANVVLLGQAIDDNLSIVPGLQAPSSVFDLVEGKPQQELSNEAQDRIEDLASQNLLLEKQVALARLTADASIDERLQLERKIALQEYTNDALVTERQEKRGLISEQERILKLKAAELRFVQKIYELENAAHRDRQKQAEEARRSAEKAQREAERAAQEQLRIYNNIRALQVSLIQQSLVSADVDVERARVVTGEAAAIKEQLSQLNARLNLEARILDIQLEKALSTTDITEQERTLYEKIYKEQRANLEAQYQTKYRMRQLDLARLQTAKQIAFAEGDRTLEDIGQQRGTQLTGLQTQLAFPFRGEEFDAANLGLDQTARRYETLIPLERQLQDMESKRANESASMSKASLELLDHNIAKKEQEIALQGMYLNELDATEQALLQQQQIYERYGFIVDEVSQALSDSITGLITGTTTVAEAFSRMFENIGKAFIDMATQMLAQQIFMTVLKALGGGAGFGAVDSQGRSFGMLVDAFADGGFVTGPTRAIIGEGGEPEYVIPASKMPGALARYASGMRGSGVIDGAVSDNRDFLNSLTTGINGSTVDVSESQDAVAATRASLRETERLRENRMQIMSQQSASERRYERERIEQMASTPGNLNIRYESQVINNVEYVTRDQAERMAAQSALRGRELAIGSLQNSVKTRKRVGIA